MTRIYKLTLIEIENAITAWLQCHPEINLGKGKTVEVRQSKDIEFPEEREVLVHD